MCFLKRKGVIHVDTTLQAYLSVARWQPEDGDKTSESRDPMMENTKTIAIEL